MPHINKRNCDKCGKYYEGVGKKYCSQKCQPSPMKGKKKILPDGSWYPIIPSICQCGCNEIVYNGYKFIKGHHNSTNENRKINSEAQKGRKHKYETIIKMKISGKRRKPIIPKGSKLSEKHKSSLRKSKEGINPWDYFKDPESVRKKQSEYRIGRTGVLCPSYIDGRSKFPYCEKWTRRFREQVRNRDNYTCQFCNKTQEDELYKTTQILAVHHIHYDKQNCYPDCITLCKSCNSKVNKKSLRKYYESLFMNKLNDRKLLFWTRSMIK